MAKPLLKFSALTAGIDWAGWFKVLALQMAVLVALAVAAITYVNWTSDAAVLEFMSTGEPSRPDVPLFSAARRVASSKQQCDRK
jgi:hypothetical protein